MTGHGWITPDWPVSPRVRAVTTTRTGGVSEGPFSSMNLASHVEDVPARVSANRAQLARVLALPAAPAWLNQVHGTRAVDAAGVDESTEADASYTCQPGIVCAVMTADCLPVLLSDCDGRCVAAVHAGWRGLAAGVIEQTVSQLQRAGSEVLAWLGPAIGPQAFTVGEEVRDVFLQQDQQAAVAFSTGSSGELRADLYQLARLRLAGCGVTDVYGGHWCTYTDTAQFYSYRRDGITGRMASLIWLASE